MTGLRAKLRALLFLLLAFLARCGPADVERATWTDAALEATVTMEQWPAHPFLAEYHRRLIVRTPEGERRTRLPIDTGGTDHVNLYRASDGRLLLRDRFDLFLIDPSTGRVGVVRKPPRRPRGTYIGAFVRADGRLAFRSAADLPETGPPGLVARD